MHGNISEWTAVWFGNYSFDHSFNPQGVSLGTFKVARGGSFSGGDIAWHSANRFYYEAERRSNILGFRLAFRQVTQQEIDLNATAQNIYAYEEKPAGTAIGVFVTNAADRGVSNTYSLLSNYPDESNFSIRGNILYSADVYDFETKPVMRLEYRW